MKEHDQKTSRTLLHDRNYSNRFDESKKDWKPRIDLKTRFHFGNLVLWDVNVDDDSVRLVTDCVAGNPVGFTLEKYALTADLRHDAPKARPIRNFLESDQVERLL